MRARAALLLLALLACAPRAGAAVIEGRITHPQRPGASAHLPVEVIGLDPQEHGIERNTVTDANGHYRFDDLPAPAAYLVRATYGGIAFPGGSAAFPPGEEKKSQTLDFHVFDASSDASRLSLNSLQWVVERNAGVWHVQESATVSNPEPSVVVIPQGAPGSILVALAPGHGKVESFFGREPQGVAIHGDVAEVRGPIFPGEEGFSLQLEYDLAQPPEALSTQIGVPSAAENVGVYVQDFGIDVAAGAIAGPSRSRASAASASRRRSSRMRSRSGSESFPVSKSCSRSRSAAASAALAGLSGSAPSAAAGRASVSRAIGAATK